MMGTGAATATACLALADGTLFYGRGFGATGEAVAELCCHTAMSGYQETLSDPCNRGKILTFMFPHIGDTGTNPDDDQGAVPSAAGVVLRWVPSAPSNWRACDTLDTWLRERGCIGIAGVDTRRLARHVRATGAVQAALCHDPDGDIDGATMIDRAAAGASSGGVSFAHGAGATAARTSNETAWSWPDGVGHRRASGPRVAVLDFGGRRDVLRGLTSLDCEVMVLPATMQVAEVFATQPAGVLLSDGPGDPATIAERVVPAIRALLDRGVPIFGIGLGHQLLGLAAGATVLKLEHGHYGANHPVRDLTSGRFAITTMNHSFAVDGASLPAGVIATHVSLFDGSNCGLRLDHRPAASVQFLPEFSPAQTPASEPIHRFLAAMAAHPAA